MESHFLFLRLEKTNLSPYDPIPVVQLDSLPLFDLTQLSSACGAHLETLFESSVVGQKHNKISYKIKKAQN